MRDMEQRGFCRAEQSIFCFAYDALPFVCLVSVPFHRQMFTKSRRLIGKGLLLLTCKSYLVKNTEFLGAGYSPFEPLIIHVIYLVHIM